VDGLPVSGAIDRKRGVLTGVGGKEKKKINTEDLLELFFL